jgi:hypothetical protein
MGYAGYGNHAESPEKPGDPHEPLQREDRSAICHGMRRHRSLPVMSKETRIRCVNLASRTPGSLASTPA